MWPFSMPTTPAFLASARQVSSGVSPPISCRSSLLQPIGLAPMRMLMSVSNALAFQRLLVIPAGGPDFRPVRHGRDGDVPPEAARVGRSRSDRCRSRSPGSSSPARAALNAASSSAIEATLTASAPIERAWAAKSTSGSDLVPRVLEEIVERRAAGRLLQAVDAAEAAIVEDDDDQLAAEHHRGRDLGIQHEVRSVADRHHDFPIRHSSSKSRALVGVHVLCLTFMRSGGMEKVARDWRKTCQEGKRT